MSPRGWPATERPRGTQQGSARPSVANLAVGWYVACASALLRDRPIHVVLFGQDHVAWRSADRKAHLQTSLCPHMGAALHDGTVVRDAIECPFHRWRFGPDGTCLSAPGRTPPRRARLRTLPVAEASGYVWVWHGPGGPLFDPPNVPALEPRRGPHLRRFSLADTTRTTPRRILENTWDPDHLVALHGLTTTGATGVAMQPAGGAHGAAIERLDATFTWPSYSGLLGTVSSLLGLNASTFTLRVRGWATCQHIEYFTDQTRVYEMVLAVTPVGDSLSVQHINVAVERERTILGPLRSLVHRAEVQVAAKQDLPVFDTLLSGDRHGIYLSSDATLRRFRQFYQRWVEHDLPA